MAISLLRSEHTGLVIVDVQNKLIAVMAHKERVIDNISKLLFLSKVYNLPVILTEQYPKMIGTTISSIKDALPVYEPVVKMEFDCCSVEGFNDHLKSLDIKRIILTGVESHICIFQTCTSLLNRSYEVHVPQDAIDSRTDENRVTGINLMMKAGATITSTETVIFQILNKAGTEEFKKMLKIIK